MYAIASVHDAHIQEWKFAQLFILDCELEVGVQAVDFGEFTLNTVLLDRTQYIVHVSLVHFGVIIDDRVVFLQPHVR